DNSDPDHLGTAFDGYNLLVTPLVLNYYTIEPIILTLEADDGFGGIVTQTVHVFIDPVNDAPVLTVPDAQDTDEDTPLVLTLEATDVDEDDLIFSAVSADPENVSAEITGDQLTLSPVQDWNGTVNIFVSVSDGELDDSGNFELTVNPVNDAPTIDLPESVTFEEDEYLTEDFSPYLYDLDQDALTLSVSGNVNVTVSIVEFEVTFGSVQDWNGTETITFTVNDAQGRDIASESMDVIVTPVNDAPEITGQDDLSTPEETPLT
ncbi:uncharacterized protein METZ01_LOCUS438185, partial [marine metagenome]